MLDCGVNEFICRIMGSVTLKFKVPWYAAGADHDLLVGSS